MLYLVYLGLFLPLAGFVGLMLSAQVISRFWTGLVACATVLIAFLCFSCILIIYTSEGLSPHSFSLFSWIPVQGINADFNLSINPLTLVMTLIISGVGFLIHVYSYGYMDHEEDFVRYFAFMNFFIFAMLLLVLAGNLLLLFVGWEGVGLASYLLIGFWYQRPSAAQAGTKAFVVNRIGDFGFLLGLLLTFVTFGTSDMAEISQRAALEFGMGAPVLTVLTLLLFVGAIGKSAQLPLHVWLPDAMEGPTPVSALIHAATMVTAGVYLVVQMHALFLLTPLTLQTIGIIGALTSLFAALCALAQKDLKRVLAYSTISQLGFMFLACGVGAFYAAIFHLMTHAFMKALLFLSAGILIHMIAGKTDMNEMGGLAKKFPKTRWLFLIGVLAMSGIPPLAAFFSKDMILEQTHLAGFEILFYVGLLSSLLTAAYLMRAYCLVFLGATRLDSTTFKAIKNEPAIMVTPVAVLALLSIIGGFIGFAWAKPALLESFLEKVGITLAQAMPENFFLAPATLMSLIGAVLAIGVTALIYTRYMGRLGKSWAVLANAFYLNEIYNCLFVVPLAAISRYIAYVIEPKIFDDSLLLVAQTTQTTASWLQQLQSGQIRSYVAWMVLGGTALIVYLVF